jgi:hypothetical protein
MRPVSANPVENPGADSSQQPGTNDWSTFDTTLPQGATESTIEQADLPLQTLEPALSPVPVEHDDEKTNTTFVHEQELQDQRSNKLAIKYSTASPLRCKKAYLIINPRAGHNFTRISEVLAILSAAGWKTHIAVKQFAGHAIELATRAAEQDYDLVIAYGGDGTINHVVNGLMAAKGKGRRKVIGVNPSPKTPLTIGYQNSALWHNPLTTIPDRTNNSQVQCKWYFLDDW